MSCRKLLIGILGVVEEVVVELSICLYKIVNKFFIYNFAENNIYIILNSFN